MKRNSRLKDMKGYLSEQPLLRHIGKDEKQTANVHGVLKSYRLALHFLFVLKVVRLFSASSLLKSACCCVERV